MTILNRLYFDHTCRCARRPNTRMPGFATLFSLMIVLSSAVSEARDSSNEPQLSEKVIVDTDIGIDIDDAFAVALLLRSPELDILGFSTASGDTVARARILDRMLGETGRENIPVAVGVPSTSPDESMPPGLIGPQRRYGEYGHYPRASHPPADEFILDQIRRFPGQITLVAIGPLSNVGSLIDKDIGAFRKLKRIVMMGGWIAPFNDDAGQTRRPGPEYNIKVDVRSAQKLFNSGVPIYVFPLDSTVHLALDEVNRRLVFSEGTPVTDSLSLLYLQWGGNTPVLYDAMPVAFLVDPRLCPVEPMRIFVDDGGVTHSIQGPPNAQVCLRSDPNVFMEYYMARIVDIRK